MISKTTASSSSKYTVNGRTYRNEDRAARAAWEQNAVAVTAEGEQFCAVLEGGHWGRAIFTALPFIIQ